MKCCLASSDWSMALFNDLKISNELSFNKLSFQILKCLHVPKVISSRRIMTTAILPESGSVWVSFVNHQALHIFLAEISASSAKNSTVSRLKQFVI